MKFWSRIFNNLTVRKTQSKSNSWLELPVKKRTLKPLLKNFSMPYKIRQVKKNKLEIPTWWLVDNSLFHLELTELLKVRLILLITKVAVVNSSEMILKSQRATKSNKIIKDQQLVPEKLMYICKLSRHNFFHPGNHKIIKSTTLI